MIPTDVALPGLTPSNKPMKLPAPPQRYRSIIETPVQAAGPQLIGQALSGPVAPPREETAENVSLRRNR